MHDPVGDRVIVLAPDSPSHQLALALLVPRSRLHFPIFGFFAALGLMAMLALSPRSARTVRVEPEPLWDWEFWTLVSAFVVSRTLLIAANFKSFLQYPLQFIALPSLTDVGLLLTALLSFAYLRRRRMSLLQTLDAAAPGAALATVFLALGRVFEGLRDGLPTHVPWAVNDTMVGPVHPVETYAALAAGLLFFVLTALLPRGRTGEVTAVGLLFGGQLLFLLSFFRQPSNLLLDPDEVAGLLMIVAGAAVLAWMVSRGGLARASAP